ncbi:hypothetical protein IE077_004449, partial [Cardiosporidium cionae]
WWASYELLRTLDGITSDNSSYTSSPILSTPLLKIHFQREEFFEIPVLQPFLMNRIDYLLGVYTEELLNGWPYSFQGKISLFKTISDAEKCILAFSNYFNETGEALLRILTLFSTLPSAYLQQVSPSVEASIVNSLWVLLTLCMQAYEGWAVMETMSTVSPSTSPFATFIASSLPTLSSSSSLPFSIMAPCPSLSPSPSPLSPLHPWLAACIQHLIESLSLCASLFSLAEARHPSRSRRAPLLPGEATHLLLTVALRPPPPAASSPSPTPPSRGWQRFWRHLERTKKRLVSERLPALSVGLLSPPSNATPLEETLSWSTLSLLRILVGLTSGTTETFCQQETGVRDLQASIARIGGLVLGTPLLYIEASTHRWQRFLLKERQEPTEAMLRKACAQVMYTFLSQCLEALTRELLGRNEETQPWVDTPCSAIPSLSVFHWLVEAVLGGNGGEKEGKSGRFDGRDEERQEKPNENNARMLTERERERRLACILELWKGSCTALMAAPRSERKRWQMTGSHRSPSAMDQLLVKLLTSFEQGYPLNHLFSAASLRHCISPPTNKALLWHYNASTCLSLFSELFYYLYFPLFPTSPPSSRRRLLPLARPSLNILEGRLELLLTFTVGSSFTIEAATPSTWIPFLSAYDSLLGHLQERLMDYVKAIGVEKQRACVQWRGSANFVFVDTATNTFLPLLRILCMTWPALSRIEEEALSLSKPSKLAEGNAKLVALLVYHRMHTLFTQLETLSKETLYAKEITQQFVFYSKEDMFSQNLSFERLLFLSALDGLYATLVEPEFVKRIVHIGLLPSSSARTKNTETKKEETKVFSDENSTAERDDSLLETISKEEEQTSMASSCLTLWCAGILSCLKGCGQLMEQRNYFMGDTSFLQVSAKETSLMNPERHKRWLLLRKFCIFAVTRLTQCCTLLFRICRQRECSVGYTLPFTSKMGIIIMDVAIAVSQWSYQWSCTLSLKTIVTSSSTQKQMLLWEEEERSVFWLEAQSLPFCAYTLLYTFLNPGLQMHVGRILARLQPMLWIKRFALLHATLRNLLMCIFSMPSAKLGMDLAKELCRLWTFIAVPERKSSTKRLVATIIADVLHMQHSFRSDLLLQRSLAMASPSLESPEEVCAAMNAWRNVKERVWTMTLKALILGLNPILEICDDRAKQHVYALLGEKQQYLFETLNRQFEEFHKYKGKT